MTITSVDIAGGWNFNDHRTNLVVVGSWFKRDGLLASERDYSRSVDTRDFLPPSWAGDTQFRNTSNLSPWGTYQAGSVNAQGLFVGQRVRLGTPNITNTSGVFHIQPVGDAGFLYHHQLHAGRCRSTLLIGHGNLEFILSRLQVTDIYFRAAHRCTGNRIGSVHFLPLVRTDSPVRI